jgi:circadian clock protein KaiC
MERDPREGGVSYGAQIPTGVPGLDRLLNGGLRRGALHVVLGGPGAGKSVLAHQVGAHLIRGGGRVLYLTALVETHQTLIAQARTFRFFDPAAVPNTFYYASLYPVMARDGLNGAREEIGRLVAHHDPTLVIVDGVHALKITASSKLEYQRFMHEMEAQAAVSGVTTLMLTHPEEALASDPTFTIADGILHLRAEEVGLRTVRMISVEKLRGVPHMGGWHTFAIRQEGMHIFPRLEALTVGMEALAGGTETGDGADPRVDFAIDGLGKMLGGGVPRGSATVVIGTPGSGKTLTGMAFLSAGADAGEPGLFFGFHEGPESLCRKADGVGLSFRRGVEAGTIHAYWRAPTEMLADEVAERLLEMVQEHGIRRVVIDAIEDIRHSVIPSSREMSFLSALANLLRHRGVTTVMLLDLTRIAGINFDLPMPELAAVMDNVLHLRFVEQKSELHRMVAILKMRAGPHDHAMRELRISAKGMEVGKPFDRSELVLTGLALPR